MPNPIDVSAIIRGLIPYEKYNYSFSSTAGNWPIVVNPISGSFTATTASGKVDATVYFCLSKTGCLECEGRLSHSNCLCNIGDDPFSKIQISYYPVNDPNNVYKSETIKIICSGCFPQMTIIPSGNSIKKETEQEISVNFNNLIPNKTYKYSFESIDSDWPYSLSSTSGLIYAHDKTEKLTVYGGFCATTGSCPNNHPGVLTYSVKNNNGIKNWYKTEASFRLLLTDPDCPTIIHYSDIVNIRCLDCTSNGGHVNVGVNISEGADC